MVAIEQLSCIFPKVADYLHQPEDPPKKQSVTKSVPIPNKVCPTRDKHIPAEQHTIIEDDDGNSNTDFQLKVHISPSDPHIILPDIPVPPPRVRPEQPPRMDTGGQSSNLRSSCKRNPVPNFSLAAQFLQVIEANAVTHQISGVSKEYRHLVKGPDSVWIETINRGERTNQINSQRKMLDFTGNINAPTAYVTTEKCVFNSVVSTLG